jgi:hypothetical protein
MPGHPWHYCLLFLGERKKLRRKLTHQVAQPIAKVVSFSSIWIGSGSPSRASLAAS